MLPATFPSAEIVVGIVVAWMALGIAGIAHSDRRRFIAAALFPASAALSIVLAVVALSALPAPPVTLVLPLGLPELPFHLRLDPLSAFFLLLLGLGSFGVSVYAGGYFRPSPPRVCGSSTSNTSSSSRRWRWC